MQEVAAKRYSNALFNVGKERNKLDSFLNQLKYVSEIFMTNSELQRFIKSPNIAEEQKQELIEEVFKEKIEIEIFDLLLLLLENKRIEEIGIIYVDFKALTLEHKGIKIAIVTTAVSLRDDEADILKNKLTNTYGTDFEIENIVDTSVIGGISVRIGDELLDGTIKGKLEIIRKTLINE